MHYQDDDLATCRSADEPNDESSRSIEEADEMVAEYLAGTREPFRSADEMFEKLGIADAND